MLSPEGGLMVAGVLAVDPGSERSALVLMSGARRIEHRLYGLNEAIVRVIEALRGEACELVVEVTPARSMLAKGSGKGFFPQQVLDTAVWAGEMRHAFGRDRTTFVSRHDVKLELLGSPRGSDAHIRQACIDYFGGQARAIGGRKCPACKGKGWRGRGRPPCDTCDASGWEHPPGPLADISGDLWSALAVGVTWWRMASRAPRGVDCEVGG